MRRSKVLAPALGLVNWCLELSGYNAAMEKRNSILGELDKLPPKQYEGVSVSKPRLQFEFHGARKKPSVLHMITSRIDQHS